MHRRGYSLVELMIVVGIAGILSSMVVKKVNQFKLKARQIEAPGTLKIIANLFESFQIENGTYVPSGVIDPTPGFHALNLSTSDDSSISSCNVANGYGFKINNCKNAYFYYSCSVNSKSFVCFAVSLGTGAFGKIASGLNCVYEVGGGTTDMWSINQDNQIIHHYDLTRICR